MNALLLTDGYKTSHHLQYPKGTTKVYSNFTPRSNKYAPKGCDEIVVFGNQMVVKKIHEIFSKDFFSQPKETAIGLIKRELDMYLGFDYDVSHFEALHTLGYLPIRVKGLSEGISVPMKTPVLTIVNTLPEFYWITNYLETIISNLLWKPMTSATIAKRYKEILVDWAMKTDKENVSFVDFQGHDFSMRGMDSIDAVVSSGLGHLTSFKGTDSLPAIWGAREYYSENDFVAASVPATEHSVMCAGSKDGEIETFRSLITTFPSGILSVVSDTWDLWKVCTEYLPQLKEQIMARDGKLVIRPDSGDPVDIICGELGLEDAINNATFDSDLQKQLSHRRDGVIELLWYTFGGTVNEQGYKVLDSHIGAIYGDSITIDRAEEICKRLAAKGFASTNIVLGIGSFTYQYNTRDTFGFAMKATYVEINGEGREIFKNPVTDDGTKKSATGLLLVKETELGEIILVDKVTPQQEELGLLQDIYIDGRFYNQVTLSEIRGKI